jgi:hypothetical protein
MCQCGCSEFYKRFKLPGTDGIFWVVEIGHGCSDCQTPAGVIFIRLGPGHAYELEAINELEFEQPERHSRTEKAFVVADPEKIYQVALRHVCESHGVSTTEDIPGESMFEEWELRDDIYQCIAEQVTE